MPSADDDGECINLQHDKRDRRRSEKAKRISSMAGCDVEVINQDDDGPSASNNKRRKRIRVLASDDEDDESLRVQHNNCERHRSKIAKRSSSKTSDDLEIDGDDSRLCVQKERKRTVKIPWTTEELNILEQHFKNFLKSDALPGFALIKEVQKRFPVLQKRTPPQIKARFVQLREMKKKHQS